MKEKILVCINNPAHAEQLVRRGKVLADAFKGEYIILNVCTNSEVVEKNFEQLHKKKSFEILSEMYGADLIVKPLKGKTVAQIIGETTEEMNITQIVLGQAVKSKLEQLVNESKINSLFKMLEGVDIHLVEVSGDHYYESSAYELGIPAYLSMYKEGYQLSFEADSTNYVKGVFFKEKSTDFENGYFLLENTDENKVLKIIRILDGVVVTPDLNKVLG